MKENIRKSFFLIFFFLHTSWEPIIDLVFQKSIQTYLRFVKMNVRFYVYGKKINSSLCTYLVVEVKFNTKQK